MYRKSVLDNGIRVVTSEMPHTRSVAIGVFVGVGSRYETEREAGISHFIEHMCFKGTRQRRNPSDISGAIEGVGGMLNAGTDKEMTIYWCKVAQPHFELAFDVIVDMLRNSRFDPSDIEKERQVIIEEIRMTRDTPAQEVSLIIDQLLWPDHPMGRDTAGTKESVSAIDREMLLRFMQTKYSSRNTVVAISGAINHQTALEAVRKGFAGWGDSNPAPRFSPFNNTVNPRIKVQKRDTEEAHLCLSVPGLSLADPRRFAVDLLNVVLGEGMSSRLFTEIRDNLGLAYNIFSYADHFLDSGALTVCAGVEPRNLETTIKASLQQLRRLKDELVPDAELAKAKELSKGRTLLRMEDSRNVNGWIGAQEVLTGRILSVDEVIAIVDAVTAEEIKAVANELLLQDKLRLAVVGPIPQSESDRLEALLRL